MNIKKWKLGIIVAAVIGFFTACIAAAALDGIIINFKFFLFFIGLMGKDIILYLKDHPVDQVSFDTEIRTKPNPIIGPKGPFPMILFFAALAAVACVGTGCASSRVHTLETHLDGTKVETEVRAHTFFDSKSELAKPKASVTEKTASSAVGSMSQESSGSNAVQVVKIIVEGAISAAK